MEQRLDQYLVDHLFVTSRSKAQDAIQEGRVYVNEKVVSKNAYIVTEEDKVEVKKEELCFASRAGFKLYYALMHFPISLKDRIVIDIGASTGGFSDVCLQKGAAYVYAVDVGHSQLIERLRCDKRICNMEKTNCRFLEPAMFDKKPSFACIDVSFISLKLILPGLLTILEGSYDIVALIKPQFEAGPQEVGKKGIIKNDKVHIRILQEMVDYVHSLGVYVHHLEVSKVLGRDGNKEFLMHIRKEPIQKVFLYKQIVQEKINKR